MSSLLEHPECICPNLFGLKNNQIEYFFFLDSKSFCFTLVQLDSLHFKGW